MKSATTPRPVQAASTVQSVLSHAATFDSAPASGFVAAKEVASIYSVSTNTVWRWARTGRIPQPVKIGANTTRWKVGEIRESLASLTAGEA